MSGNDFFKVPEYEIKSLNLHDCLKDIELLEPSQTTQLKKANKTLDNYLPKIETIAQDAKEQSQSASDQVEHLKKIADSLELQVKTAIADSESAKSDSAFAKSLSILSILIAFVALFI